MSTSLIIEYVVLGITVVIGICSIYAAFAMRRFFAEQRGQFMRAISAVQEYQKLEPRFITLLRRVESDEQTLQKIAEQLRDRYDVQEQRIAKIAERILDIPRSLPKPAPVEEPQPQPIPQEAQAQSEPQQKHDYGRLRKEVLSLDPQLRFSVLRDWISTNALAILYRASREWTTANDLIANVPSYLEPEAEVLGDRVLLIGTREHAGRLAIALRDLEPSSDLTQWFDVISSPQAAPFAPAVLLRADDGLELISKGTNTSTGNELQ